MSALNARVQSECPGVLSALGASPSKARAAQLEALELEVEGTVAGAWAAPDAAQFAAFAATLRRLHWSMPAVNAKDRYELTAFQLRFAAAPGDVCADARAWQLSGFQTLSPSTLSFAKAEQARAAALVKLARQISRLAPHSTLASTNLDVVLGAGAPAGDRRLERENAKLNDRLAVAVETFSPSANALLAVLGAPAHS